MTVGAWVVTVLLIAVGLGVAVGGFAVYASADHLGVLNDPVVVEQARAACNRLNDEVLPAGPVGTDVGERVQRIREGDAAIGRLIDTMHHQLDEEQLVDDDPVVAWIDDWETLRALRETYADELSRGGSPQLVVPTVDDVSITVRMSELSTCTVTPQLAKGL